MNPRRCLAFLLFIAISHTGMAQQFKMEGKPGEAPGSWIFATIGVGKKPDGSPKTTALKGLAIRVGDGGAAVCYDLDLCRMAGGWTGGFTTPMNLMSRGDFPRSIGSVCFTSSETAGFQVVEKGSQDAGSQWKDPRDEPFGPLPEVKYRGMHRLEKAVAIAWEVAGIQVLESPSYERAEDVDRFRRTFGVSAHKEPILIPICEHHAAGGPQVRVWSSTGTPVELIENEFCVRVPPSPATAKFAVEILVGPDAAKIDALVHSFESRYSVAQISPTTDQPGPLWPEPVVTRGEISTSKDDAYVVDSVNIPDQNSWKAPMFIGGFDFFPDGRAAVCTFHGDVFIVSGLDDKLDHVTWRRFASGLYHALGLKIVNGDIYVTCRDGITRLKDLSGKGEATFYERFNNDLKVTASFHEFVFDLQTDPAGNFYFAKAGPVKNGGRGFDRMMDQHGTLMRVSPDGKSLDIVATGFRAPNGIGISPKGELTSGDNEGTWTPACKINWVEKNGFYGCVPTSHRNPLPTTYDKPLCWLPKRVDNSSGGQVWVPDDPRWGPWRGELLHTSYGQCALFGVMKESVADPAKPDCCDQAMQGGVVQFPLKFQSGIMRARFNPTDGQLYVAGLRGWQTSGLKNGCFQRARYTGAPVRMPVELHARKDGMEVRFTCSVDTQQACDPENWGVETWNYIWSSAYGSPEISTVAGAAETPREEGRDGELQYTKEDLTKSHHDTLSIKSITAGTDDRSVFLEIPGMKPVMQMSIRYRIKAADGVDLRGEIVNTIHAFSE